MAIKQDGHTIAFEVDDAKSVLKATKKYFPRMKRKGITDAEVKEFAQTILAAEGLGAGDEREKRLAKARQALKDSLGDYRDAAELAASGIEGTNKSDKKKLKVGGRFPSSDPKLLKYVEGLPDVLKAYSAKLVDRDFSVEAQKLLVQQIAEFKAAEGDKGKVRAAKAARSRERTAVYKRLRIQTSYFRNVGRKALKTSAERAEFDRVQLNTHKAKAAPTGKAANTAKTKKAPPKEAPPSGDPTDNG